MVPEYLLLRLARRFLPERAARLLLRRGLVIHPGLETSAPRAAAARYREVLEKEDFSLAGKRVLVFGYGGSFAVGVELLRLGAAHAALCDPYAPADDRRNRALLPANGEFLFESGGQIQPRPEWIALFHEDIRAVAAGARLAPVDIVLSSSVYEHLPAEDMPGITAALARLTTPEGIHLHFVDLRDHFFKYPFEMLAFSAPTWRRWLNPGSNLNRLRLPDYRRVFEEAFRQVHIAILEHDFTNFEKARPRIHAEFLTGNAEVDAVTQILVLASHPRL
jgi:hypothetical protein